jgi:multisubunit Na+/H+ antiporter MnhG subunit
VTAAVAATAAMESATATVEVATTTVEAASAVIIAAVAIAAMEPTSNLAMSVEAPAIMPPVATVTPVSMSPVSRASIEATMEPRACTDEDAAREPARPVVAVGSACVGVIRVVTVGADGSWSEVTWADSHAHDDPLCMSVRCYGQAKTKQSENHQVFGVSHI